MSPPGARRSDIAQRSYEILGRLKSATAKRGQIDAHADDGLIRLEADIVECAERFTIWMGELGILQEPQSELPSDDDVQKYMHRRLDGISDALDKVVPLLQTARNDRWSGRQATVFLSPNDIRTEIARISQEVTYLFRAGALMIAPATSGLARQSRQTPSIQAMGSVFKYISHLQKKHAKLSNDKIINRLAASMMKRRQLLDNRRTQRGGQDTAASSTTCCSGAQGHGANTQTSSLTANDSQDPNGLPMLSSLSPSKKPFKCPYCDSVQHLDTEDQWRSHALHDFKPYICTVGLGEECDQLLFADRDSWFSHEVTCHRATYICVLCHDRREGSDKDIEAHIVEEHDADSMGLEGIRRLVEIGQVPLETMESQDCPFCDDLGGGSRVSARKFMLHIAMHQEDLAAYSASGRLNEASQENSLGDEVVASKSLPEDLADMTIDPQPTLEKKLWSSQYSLWNYRVRFRIFLIDKTKPSKARSNKPRSDKARPAAAQSLDARGEVQWALFLVIRKLSFMTIRRKRGFH